MKKVIIFLISVFFAFIFNSCSFSVFSEQKDLQEQINQLQQEVAALQKINGLTPSYDIKDDTSASPAPAKSDATKGEDDNTAGTAKTGKEQLAIEAIKYCLKMYVPDLQYTDIRSAPKSDGTVDVIIDYKEYGDIEHTYYNVSVYSDTEFMVNNWNGNSTGRFPYGSKFIIQ